MKWTRSWFISLSVMWSAIVVSRIFRLKDVFTSHDAEYNDSGCILKGSMIGAEDMCLGKEGKLFLGASGNLPLAFTEGASTCQSGGIWFMDVNKPDSEPVLLEIEDYPHKTFHAHGLYVSNITDRLYVVNHLGTESMIEVFQIHYQRSVYLSHLKTIRSHLFLRYGINDVIEGKNSSEIYVTQWLVFPFPEQGKNHPDGWREWLEQRIFVPAILLLGLPLTAVYRCDTRTDVCEVASDSLFVSANGITTTPDRNSVFVADWTDKKVAVMKRQENGWLELQTMIHLPFSVDNLEFDCSSGDLMAGTMPDLQAVLRMTHGEKISIPGGMSVIYLEDGEWHHRDVLYHDGRKLSHISSANRFKNTVYLSSPSSMGILQCNL